MPDAWTYHDLGSHFQVRDETEFPIAEVYGRSAFGREICEARARLIAAAPELLAACKTLLASLRYGMTDLAAQGVRSAAFQSRADDTAAAFRDLKAVIARVEGPTDA